MYIKIPHAESGIALSASGKCNFVFESVKEHYFGYTMQLINNNLYYSGYDLHIWAVTMKSTERSLSTGMHTSSARQFRLLLSSLYNGDEN